MRIPAITGLIERRILANYRVDPERMSKVLPSPFRPKLVNGYAIGGICLIRLKRIRPKFLPIPWGIGSENAAHRIAVEWEFEGDRCEGVYIPRRDTNSISNSFAGGRLFPGSHHLSAFEVDENNGSYSVSMTSRDETTSLHVEGKLTDNLPESSVFKSVNEASVFFEKGSLGYSKTSVDLRYDGLELRCKTWDVKPLDITSVYSSYFEDQDRFPSGTVEFDCALLMKDISHEWHGLPDLKG